MHVDLSFLKATSKAVQIYQATKALTDAIRGYDCSVDAKGYTAPEVTLASGSARDGSVDKRQVSFKA